MEGSEGPSRMDIQTKDVLEMCEGCVLFGTDAPGVQKGPNGVWYVNRNKEIRIIKGPSHQSACSSIAYLDAHWTRQFQNGIDFSTVNLFY